MNDLDQLGAEDLLKIRTSVNHKYTKALIGTLIFTIPLLFISPYIPSKRHGSLIESRGYWEAVVFFAIFWFSMLVIVAIYNNYRARNIYITALKHLQIVSITAVVDKIKYTWYDLDFAMITLNPIGSCLIDKQTARQLNIGDKVDVRVEKTTATVLELS